MQEGSPSHESAEGCLRLMMEKSHCRIIVVGAFFRRHTEWFLRLRRGPVLAVCSFSLLFAGLMELLFQMNISFPALGCPEGMAFFHLNNSFFSFSVR
jgi:hypothetical protein